MQPDLFDTVPGFDWKHIKTDTSSRYVDIKSRNIMIETLTRLEETKQKCFIVVAEGFTSYGRRDDIYCVFPTVIIHYLTDPCIPNWYTINFHSLGVHALQCFKLSKLSQGQGTHLVLPIFQSFDKSIQSELALSKSIIVENCRKEMDDIIDEKLSLETELAKYKGIVENFRKELSPYRF